MSTVNNVGLIACSPLDGKGASLGKVNGNAVKKVFMTGDFSPEMLIKRYPQAEIVQDAQSIFQDTDIDLVIVSSPSSDQLDIAGEALQAGKHVRII